MIKLAAIASICTALAATPVVAQAEFGEYTPSVEACLSLGTISDITERLARDGWSISPTPLAQPTINQLAWPQAATYLHGDKGGESLRNILDLQKRTIVGYSKKRDLPTSKTRILTRGEGADYESLLLLWQVPYPFIGFVRCRFALKADAYSETFDTAIKYLGSGPLGPNKTFSTTVLNADLLSDQIGSTVTVGVALETNRKFSPAEVAQ